MSDGDVLRQKVVQEMKSCDKDFILTDTVARRVDVSRAEAVGVLDELFRDRVIRHPVGWEHNINMHSQNESEWWRLKNRGYTRGEKRRMMFAGIGLRPISNGEISGEY